MEYVAPTVPTNVSIWITFYSQHGQVMLMCNNEMVGTHFEKLPPSGVMRCYFPKVPFTAGIYSMNVYCDVNGILADWVQQAARVAVEQGDYFGTGRLPPESHGGLLAQHEWSYAGK